MSGRRRPSLHVTGVYAVLHLEDGSEIEATQLTRLEIKGNLVTFHLTAISVSRGGRVTATTLHLGRQQTGAMRAPSPPFVPGDDVTAVHPLEIGGLEG